MIVESFVSRPTEVVASEPLTPDNRDDIWKWVSSLGGWAQVLPDGYRFGLRVQTVQGAKVDVKYGDRVLLNPTHNQPDFWPIDPVVFEVKYDTKPEARAPQP